MLSKENLSPLRIFFPNEIINVIYFYFFFELKPPWSKIKSLQKEDSLIGKNGAESTNVLLYCFKERPGIRKNLCFWITNQKYNTSNIMQISKLYHFDAYGADKLNQRSKHFYDSFLVYERI